MHVKVFRKWSELVVGNMSEPIHKTDHYKQFVNGEYAGRQVIHNYFVILSPMKMLQRMV